MDIYGIFEAAHDRDLWAAVVGAAVDTNGFSLARGLPEPKFMLLCVIYFYVHSYTYRIYHTALCE